MERPIPLSRPAPAKGKWYRDSLLLLTLLFYVLPGPSAAVPVADPGVALLLPDTVPWDQMDLTRKPFPPECWRIVDLTGPEYKPKDRKFPWWALTPVAATPLLFLLDGKEETVAPPDLYCPNVTVEWVAPSHPFDPGAIEVTNYCPEGDVTITLVGDMSNNGPGCADAPLIINRTYRATDECGNTSTCTQEITVIDTQPPELNNPPTDTAFECDGQGNMEDINTWLNSQGGAVATDLHGEVTWRNDYNGQTSGCGESTTVNFTAADVCGNTLTTTAAFSVFDNTPPTVTCPPDLSISCEDDRGPAATGAATAVDNCTLPEAITITFTDDESGLTGCNGTGVLLRTWTAVDACGNESACEQSITIVDETAPTITCPEEITLFCDDPIDPEFTGFPTAEDNCGPVTIDFTDAVEGDCPATVTRTFSATDACGNESSCEQLINLVSTGCDFDPTVTILNDPTCLNADGAVTITLGQPGDYTITWSDGSTGNEVANLPAGTYTVTIVDNAIQCAQVVTITLETVPYELGVVATVNPSLPGASDGSITLIVVTPAAIPPFDVVVNGAFFTQVADPNFELTGLPAGLYDIFIVDNAGGGCQSNLVTAILEDPPPTPAFAVPLIRQRNGLPDWRDRHQVSFPLEPVTRWLESQSVEHPFPDLTPVFTYTAGPPVTAGLRHELPGGWQLRWGLYAHNGRGIAEVEAPRLTIRSDFQSWTSDFGLRRFASAGRWAPFAGMGLRWHRLSVGDSRVHWEDRAALLDDAYAEDQLRGFLTTGIRLNIKEEWYLELEGEWWYPGPERQHFDLSPQLGTEVRFRF